MPYIVEHGEVHLNGAVYRVGDTVPGEKGSLEEVRATGIIDWYEPMEAGPPVHTPPRKRGTRKAG